MATTEKVLSEIGAGELPRILVLNKIDIADQAVLDQWGRIHPGSLAVSAKTGRGLDRLALLIEKTLTSDMEEVVLAIPHSDYSLIPLIHREGVIVEEKTEDERSIVRCRIPRRLEGKIGKYRQTGQDKQ
jgi:GTP-binding protein HflX